MIERKALAGDLVVSSGDGYGTRYLYVQIKETTNVNSGEIFNQSYEPRWNQYAYIVE